MKWRTLRGANTLSFLRSCAPSQPPSSSSTRLTFCTSCVFSSFPSFSFSFFFFLFPFSSFSFPGHFTSRVGYWASSVFWEEMTGAQLPYQVGPDPPSRFFLCCFVLVLFFSPPSRRLGNALIGRSSFLPFCQPIQSNPSLLPSSLSAIIPVSFASGDMAARPEPLEGASFLWPLDPCAPSLCGCRKRRRWEIPLTVGWHALDATRFSLFIIIIIFFLSWRMT